MLSLGTFYKISSDRISNQVISWCCVSACQKNLQWGSSSLRLHPSGWVKEVTGRISRITLIMNYKFWMFYLYVWRITARGWGPFPLSLLLTLTWGAPALLSFHCLISTCKIRKSLPSPPWGLMIWPIHQLTLCKGRAQTEYRGTVSAYN